MIRTAILLARTSLVSVLFLGAALMTLVTVLSDTPENVADTGPSLAAALVPMAKPRALAGDVPAAARIALFDPERRSETVSGSIDDLRGIAAPPPLAANVTIGGVLLQGNIRKAMLGVTGGPAAWNEVGAAIGGWRVASIDAEGAVLEHNGRSVALKIADRLNARSRPRSSDGSPPAPGGGPPGGVPVDTLLAPDPVVAPKP